MTSRRFLFIAMPEQRRRLPKNARPGKLGPRSSIGRFDEALQTLVTAAKGGHDTSRQQRAMSERVRRMLRAERKRA